jgi:dephospho-CoA kinase
MSIPFIGLTGGLGAGKSTALSELEALDAAVISSDVIVHELYAQPQVCAAVVEKFGDDVCSDGEIDRAALARVVFADPQARSWLEEFLWPQVAIRIAEFRAEATQRTPPPVAVVVESPLLFEAGMAELYDATVAVTADSTVRRERLALRDHEALAERERRQLSQDEKARRASFVVPNSGTRAELSARLSAVLDLVGARDVQGDDAPSGREEAPA